MKLIAVIALCFLLAGASFAAPLAATARFIIPSEVQQIISVDYRALKSSPTALALKDRVLPDNMKQFESSVRAFGLNPDQDIDQLSFIAFRAKDQSLHILGLAQGMFPYRQIIKRFAVKKIKPNKYRSAYLYPANGGVQMTFLDEATMLFGEPDAIKIAIDTRDGFSPSLTSNSQIADMMTGVQDAGVWSVLDKAGTENMLRSALGDASQLTDYNTIKQRVTGSRYTMDFDNGVNFKLDVFTTDNMTAASLSSLLRAGVMYRKQTATGVEKVALDSVSVDSDSDKLKLNFKTDDKRFQALLQSDLFAAVSR
jgi:hypothetical protein